MPVISTRRESMAASSLPEPDGLALADHVPEVLLDPAADVLGDGLDERLVGVEALFVEADGLEESDLELGRQVADNAEQASVRERRREREVQEPGELLERLDLREHRGGLLGPHDAHRHDRRARAHGGLDEPAAAEAPQFVAVLVELL